MPLDLPPDAGKVWLPPRPGIIRSAEHALLRPGAFRPCSRAERQAILADLVRSGRMTREEARRAIPLLMPVVAWDPGGTYLIDRLVVAGGGAGRGNGAAGNSGDGGYGGGVSADTDFSVTVGASYDVVVGLGGTGVANAAGNPGGDSSFDTLTATGGIGGQNTSSSVARRGGDGAGGAGGVPVSGSYAGAGGVGVASSISGTSIKYGPGGGGGFTYGAAGGADGGGHGQSYGGGDGTAGTDGRGAGGGGRSSPGSYPGFDGGDGVVIIRYLGAQRGTGGTVTSSGGYTIHTFTASGTFVA